jgi:hypothetical protein
MAELFSPVLTAYTRPLMRLSFLITAGKPAHHRALFLVRYLSRGVK